MHSRRLFWCWRAKDGLGPQSRVARRLALRRGPPGLVARARSPRPQQKIEKRAAARTSTQIEATPTEPELWDEVDRLPRDLRHAVILCYLEGLTHEQAAFRLGLARGYGPQPAGQGAGSAEDPTDTP